MKRLIPSVLLGFWSIAAFGGEAALLNVTADKFAHSPGETIEFKVFALDSEKKPAEAAVTWKVEADDGRPAESGSGTATPENPVVVKTSLDRPGFVRITAKFEDASKTKRFIAGAAVEPEKLEALPEPDDFDAFWEEQKRLVDAADLSKAELQDVPESVSSIARFKGMSVRKLVFPFAEGMVPATAWLVMPKDAAPKSIRAIKASFDGYGYGGKRPPEWFDRNAINLHINAHGYELDRDEEYYKEFEAGTKSNGQAYGMDPKQNGDRETCYFRGMLLRDMAAIRFAKTLPEWSGDALEVTGGSQGGFQCVAMAALVPGVTFCMPNAPWLCDMGGSAKLGRMNSWHPQFVPALRYFDTVNFAKRVRCATKIQRSGLGDYTCAPSGVTILYNNLKDAKSRSIHYIQGSEHLSDWNPPNPDWRQTFDKNGEP